MHSAKLASPDVAFEFFEIEPPTICVLLVNQFRRPEIKQSISPLIIDYLISAASGTKNVNFSGGVWESGIFLELRNGKTNVALQFRLCTVKYWTVLGTGQHCTVQSWVLSRTDYSTAQYSRWCYVAKSPKGRRGAPQPHTAEVTAATKSSHQSQERTTGQRTHLIIIIIFCLIIQ